MPVPLHFAEDIEALGEAAFLYLEPGPEPEGGLHGAVLLLNALGEPLEFAYNRIKSRHGPSLWRAGEQSAGAARRLVASLLECVEGSPRLLLCRADFIGSGVLGPAGLLQTQIPVARIALPDEAGGSEEENETILDIPIPDARGESCLARVFWSPPGLPADHPAAALFARLALCGLLLEPFERARAGLREVYGNAPPRRAPF